MVKEGYKETEIGIIPEDWDIVSFKKCFNILPNNTLPRAELNETCGTVKNIHYGDILVKYNSVLNCSVANIPYINTPNKNMSSMYLMNGDIIIADTAEDDTVGKATEISNIAEHRIVSGLHTIPCRAFSSNMFSNGWLGYFINCRIYHDQLLPFITGTKVSAISKSAISDTLVVIPSLKEQQKIVDALSDMDNLISSLEKLIEKKKVIKQGAMQELLTGGKQLYSNANELEEIPIKDLFSYINGKSLEEFFNYNSGYKVISIGNYSSEGTFIDTNTYIDHSYKAQFHNLIASNNDLVMILNDKTSIGTILGRVLLIDKDDSYIINQRSVILRLKNDKFCAKYFYYLLNSKYVRKNIMKKSKPGTQIYLNLPDVLELSVKYTSDIKEQQIIANTLSDIDAEIAALEQKLTKCQKLKQGMMQQLLTGNIRLV